MQVNSEPDFIKAKAISEPEFDQKAKILGYLLDYPIVDITPGTKHDDLNHKDIKITVSAKDKRILCYVDVKDRRVHTSDSWSMSVAEYDAFQNRVDQTAKLHFLALRNYRKAKNGEWYHDGNFLICRTIDVVKYAKYKSFVDKNGEFKECYLISRKDLEINNLILQVF